MNEIVGVPDVPPDVPDVPSDVPSVCHQQLVMPSDVAPDVIRISPPGNAPAVNPEAQPGPPALCTNNMLPLLAFASQLINELQANSVSSADDAGPLPTETKRSRQLIRRDENTGEPYLHVPLPDVEKLQQLLTALGDFLSVDNNP